MKKMVKTLCVLIGLLACLTGCKREEIEKMHDSFEILDFTRGGLQITDGTGYENNSKLRMRSGYWPIGNIEIQWDIESGLQYLVAYYDDEYQLIQGTKFQTESMVVSEDDVEDAKYIRLVLSHQKKDENFGTSFEMPAECKITTDQELMTIPDEPSNQGAMNVIRRARQCVDIAYKTTSVLPAQKGDFEPNEELDGVIYSSSREESLYVPNAISFETFLTAIHDPNSYIYTRTSKTSNSKTYYGAVCSSFASYCYDLPCIYTTNQLGKLKDMERLESQNIDEMQLGDMFLRETKHVRVITGIDRDINGHVVSVYESEVTPPCANTLKHTRQAVLQDMAEKNYVIYRYSMIDDVTFEYCGWADPEQELAMTDLCPRRGNKSNWPLGEPVEIDILSQQDYDRIELYQNGALLDSSIIPDSMCMTYNDLPSGKYEVYLSNGNRKSDAASFIVVDTDVTVEKLKDHVMKIHFSSSNAIAKWYGWCNANENTTSGKDDDDSSLAEKGYMGLKDAGLIKEKDQSNGYVLAEYNPGTYLLKVEFETEYGLISSRFVKVVIL